MTKEKSKNTKRKSETIYNSNGKSDCVLAKQFEHVGTKNQFLDSLKEMMATKVLLKFCELDKKKDFYGALTFIIKQNCIAKALEVLSKEGKSKNFHGFNKDELKTILELAALMQEEKNWKDKFIKTEMAYGKYPDSNYIQMFQLSINYAIKKPNILKQFNEIFERNIFIFETLRHSGIGYCETVENIKAKGLTHKDTLAKIEMLKYYQELAIKCQGVIDECKELLTKQSYKKAVKIVSNPALINMGGELSIESDSVVNTCADAHQYTKKFAARMVEKGLSQDEVDQFCDDYVLMIAKLQTTKELFIGMLNACPQIFSYIMKKFYESIFEPENIYKALEEFGGEKPKLVSEAVDFNDADESYHFEHVKQLVCNKQYAELCNHLESYFYKFHIVPDNHCYFYFASSSSIQAQLYINAFLHMKFADLNQSISSLREFLITTDFEIDSIEALLKHAEKHHIQTVQYSIISQNSVDIEPSAKIIKKPKIFQPKEEHEDNGWDQVIDNLSLRKFGLETEYDKNSSCIDPNDLAYAEKEGLWNSTSESIFIPNQEYQISQIPIIQAQNFINPGSECIVQSTNPEVYPDTNILYMMQADHPGITEQTYTTVINTQNAEFTGQVSNGIFGWFLQG